LADHAQGLESPRPTAEQQGDAKILHNDARILKKAMHESIVTSPGSFLKTVADVDSMSPDYWDREIATSTWVVIQQLDAVVGIAVARRSDREIDCDIDQIRARFIESVWIAPKFRRSRMGERLVNYLIEVECEKCPNVSQFMLWVFEDNEYAIRLYQRMGFSRVSKQVLEGDRIELRYEYVLPSQSVERAALRSRANAVAREGDLSLTYRVLGPDVA